MEENNEQRKRTIKVLKILGWIIVLMLILAFIGNGQEKKFELDTSEFKYSSKIFNILASSENKDLESIIVDYGRRKDYDINIEYAGTLEIMQKLKDDKKYDAVWISNSIWLYMLDDQVKVSNSKYTSINPVIFGITKTKAEELGFVGKTIYTKDIVNAISSGNLKFSMSNPTTTNSGASAYLGILSTLAGNPEVLKEEHLKSDELKEELKTLFKGVERTSGSEEFLGEMFLQGDYEAVVTYESSIIELNKQLVAEGKEPLYAIYPVDGVSISDSPFAYIDKKDSYKKDVFNDLQTYILSNEGQQKLQEKGRRTWYGGINENVDKTIFNPDWGIDTTKYISPTKYPNTKVIKQALNTYQIELRKPVHVAFCLDYSGSMYGDGINELTSAMDYILTDKAANELLQFSEKDKIDVIPFSTKVMNTWKTENGIDTTNILTNIHNLKPNGQTALYDAAIQALTELQNENSEIYNSSVILMTDGQANMGTYSQLQQIYSKIEKEIPIYSIMFGNADSGELLDIAELTNGKVFDGKRDLIKAFKEVRGYN